MTERTYGNFQPTLAEFKNHIRLTTTDMDSDLDLKLKAAIRSAEHYIGAIIAQSSFVYTGPFAKTIPLEGPVKEISSVKVDGNTLEASKYQLVGNVLKFADDVTGEAVEVNYTAGPGQVEPDIKAAILLHAAALFNNPVDSVETLPKASTRLLDSYRTWGVK